MAQTTSLSSCTLSLIRGRLLSSSVLNVGGRGGRPRLAKVSHRCPSREQLVNLFQASAFHLRNQKVGHANHDPVDGAVDETNLGTQGGIRCIEEIRDCEGGDESGDDGDDGCKEVCLLLDTSGSGLRYYDV